MELVPTFGASERAGLGEPRYFRSYAWGAGARPFGLESRYERWRSSELACESLSESRCVSEIPGASYTAPRIAGRAAYWRRKITLQVRFRWTVSGASSRTYHSSH
jgi:hypothetical protein